MRNLLVVFTIAFTSCAVDPIDSRPPPDTEPAIECGADDIVAPPQLRSARPLVITFADSDGDGLDDWFERFIGTNPYDPDTDGDGLPDKLELDNDPAIPFDFVAAGADPRRRDVFVELDYEVNGSQSAKFGATLRAYLEFFFATLDIDNYDGSKGINLHLLDGSQLAAGFDCSTSVAWTYPSDYFRQAKLCLTTGGPNGTGAIGGNVLHVNAQAPDADLGNDADEPAQHAWFRVFIHELGHTFGLTHGNGLRDGGFEPNYPSVMNYGYTKGVGGGTTLATHTVEFSHGTIPEVLDECGVLEAPAFSEDASFIASFDVRTSPPLDVSYVAAGGFTVVDWDRNFADAIVPIRADLNGDGIIGKTTTGPCVSTSFKDHDDFTAIETLMAGALPGAP